MTADELAQFADQLGPTAISVVLLVVFVIPRLWAARSDGSQSAVADALMHRDIADIKKIVDDHEARIEALEKKPRRAT